MPVNLDNGYYSNQERAVLSDSTSVSYLLITAAVLSDNSWAPPNLQTVESEDLVRVSLAALDCNVPAVDSVRGSFGDPEVV